jgi:hypothetical protein
MLTKRRNLFQIGLAAVFLVGAVLACSPMSPAGAVTVVINSPANGSTVVVGQEALLDSTVTAAAGVDRVELAINGMVVRHDTPPEGNPTTFRVLQSWMPTAEGQATITVAAYAVGGASDQATITLQVVASGAVVPTDEPGTATSPPPLPPSPAPSPTPVADVSGPGGCSLNAGWVEDITIPDDSPFPSSASFAKTWRLRNTGTCTWEVGTALVFVSGDSMGGPASVPVGALAPDTDADVSVDLVAPATPGTYRGNWQMQTPDGTNFGSVIWVQIVVPEPAPEEPTEEPTEEPAEEPTEEPDLVITNLEVDTSDPRQDVPLHIVATLRNQGDATAENFRWAWRVSSTQDYIEAPGSFSLEPGEETVVQLEFTFGGYATYITEAWVDSREDVDESEEGNNTRQLVIPVHKAPPTTVTLQPVASRSGSMSSGGKGSAIRIGITQSGAAQRAFLEFDFAELPDVRQGSNVTEATLDLSGYVENPAGCLDVIGPLRVLQVNYGDSFDYPDDFDSHPVSLLSCPSTLEQLNSPTSATVSVRELIYNAGPTRIQLRLELMYDDAGASSACTIAWADPVLSVTYQP